MYYEPYEKKKKKKRRAARPKRRRSCLGAVAWFFFKLLVCVLILALLAAGVLYILPTALFMVEPDADLSLTDGLPSSPFNVLILGVDVLDEGSQRSDTMIVASIGVGTLKLTSVQRDTVVDLGEYGEQKINAAYAYGGAELAVRAVNELLDLNIVAYVVVDFTALVEMVDALGGIEVDITEAEMEQINVNVLKSRKVFEPLGYTETELTVYGEDTLLDGLRALAYARIRKIDSDFMRTSRQRTVILAMLEKLRGNLWNPVLVYNFISAGLNGIETNMSIVELISLGEKALFAGDMEQLRLPADGTYVDDGSTLTVTDREANVEKLYDFLYGTDES